MVCREELNKDIDRSPEKIKLLLKENGRYLDERDANLRDGLPVEYFENQKIIFDYLRGG